MIRITERVETSRDGHVVRTLRLEGALRGEWVAEVGHAWRHGGPLSRIELADVPFIDAVGKALLHEMHRSGVEIVARGLVCEAVRSEIVAPAPRR